MVSLRPGNYFFRNDLFSFWQKNETGLGESFLNYKKGIRKDSN